MNEKTLDLQRFPTFGVHYPKEMIPRYIREKMDDALRRRKRFEARTIWHQFDFFYDKDGL